MKNSFAIQQLIEIILERILVSLDFDRLEQAVPENFPNDLFFIKMQRFL